MRNQSINLLCKSVDWVLYDRDTRHESLNGLSLVKHLRNTFFIIIINKNNTVVTNSNNSNGIIMKIIIVIIITIIIIIIIIFLCVFRTLPNIYDGAL